MLYMTKSLHWYIKFGNSLKKKIMRKKSAVRSIQSNLRQLNSCCSTIKRSRFDWTDHMEVDIITKLLSKKVK